MKRYNGYIWGKKNLAVWLGCWVSELQGSPSVPVCPNEPEDFGNDQIMLQWCIPWSHHSRSSPGAHPALGYLVTVLSLLWWACGFPGCWVMAALNSSTNTCLCCWAGPRQGLLKHKSLPVFLFPCKNFSPMPYSWVLASAWPQWNYSVFSCGIQDKKEISCALLPGGSQRGEDPKSCMPSGKRLFSENNFHNFCYSAMDKYIPSPQAFAQVAVIGNIAGNRTGHWILKHIQSYQVVSKFLGLWT